MKWNEPKSEAKKELREKICQFFVRKSPEVVARGRRPFVRCVSEWRGVGGRGRQGGALFALAAGRTKHAHTVYTILYSHFGAPVFFFATPASSCDGLRHHDMVASRSLIMRVVILRSRVLREWQGHCESGISFFARTMFA